MFKCLDLRWLRSYPDLRTWFLRIRILLGAQDRQARGLKR